MKHDDTKLNLTSNNGNTNTILLIILILVLLFIAGIITWGPKAPKEVVDHFPSNSSQENSSVQDNANAQKEQNGQSAQNASGSDNLNDLKQGTIINITTNAAIDNSKEISKDSKASDNTDNEEKKEDLSPKYDPNNPNPVYSWTLEEKTNAPVKYHSALIAYLEKQKNKIEQDRFSIGVTCKKFEKELEKAEKSLKGSLAMLKEAAKISIDADKRNLSEVYFAYKTYKREDWRMKVRDLNKKREYAERNVNHLRAANDMMQNRLREHNKDFEMFERQLNECKQSLELIRSGKVTEISKNIIKNLDAAMAESTTNLEETFRVAEENILKPYVEDKTDADINYDDIITKYAQ